MTALAVALACGGAPRAPVPSPAVPPPPPTATAPEAKLSHRGPPAQFTPLGARILDDLLGDEPSLARDLGLHEYDGKVAPASEEAIVARVARLRTAEHDLAEIDPVSLDADEALDLAELESWVKTSLFWLVDADAPHKVPQSYEPLFAVNVYLDRDYAPLEERARRLVAQEQAALVEVRHVRENLRPPLSKPVTEVAARNMAGFVTYLRGDVAKRMGGLGDDGQRKRFAASNEALAKEAEGLAAWLKIEAARGDQSHVLGPGRFAKLLRVQEGLSLPLDEFERMNEDNLAANERAYEALAAKARSRPVKEAELFSTATQMVEDARRFVLEHAIVDLASEDAVVVRETPPYERWNSASIDMSGPFDTARSAYFQLTIPERSWPAKERQAYLGSLGDLLGTTIHEVYPGHFVQGRWASRAPTRVQKAYASYSFVEGWAHYAEEMMIDQGFGTADAANELAMLRGALLRNCRFAASLAIHTRGMTVEQVEKRFVTDCHQDVATAHEQAVRGTFDPGYFAYTLGKLQILELRDAAKKSLGERFSLRRFHDALLAHGSPPLALIHDRVMREAGQ
ncbi:MAG: DUF885 domain-containing protein [Polyangiaceae bacterium]